MMSCYFTKDGSSFYGIEMYKEREKKNEYEDDEIIVIAEVEYSSSNLRNGTETDRIKFYYKNDNHIYNSSEDMEKAYDEFKKAIGY